MCYFLNLHGKTLAFGARIVLVLLWAVLMYNQMH